ncbi:Lrp/AsnC family transcriptional regulator [Bordetella holmesii]|uniref:Winged helix-turn-helix DNA-binding protein n=2 Tax=Bordetella holmesii TaxID=35814 RepID=A0A158M9Q3_9BORD|nr:Lrp/AsnC family transcriptional regulator [Bordetella holmesii]AMD45334.1 AsnC family transcriptional regulator [Bordetella holmesii H558]AOB34220.1 AsnC family transcriptional regulator [Bordetella holmesii]AUL18237.1 AsnC family transcriptional regulator [Bordetella holmesii]AUL21552.1 AsnC family transcriptional regulator [Bordetella holmesii]AUL24871.1 AsnC family transcriptional regulator [Bordetella holmesii]
MQKTQEMTPSTTALPVLDDLDRRILEQLQRDSALTNQELALRVHASPPTCLRRVRRLTDTGIIARQVALLDATRLGSSLTAIVEITLDVQAAERLDEFEHLMLAEPAVLQCYRVSPGPDFVVIVLVRDMPAYHALAHRAFTAHANVRNVRTFFSVHRAKFETRVELPPATPAA